MLQLVFVSRCGANPAADFSSVLLPHAVRDTAMNIAEIMQDSFFIPFFPP
jgi:hypothetical protein